ncbi:MAG: glycosyltransferase family 4 protein [Candidatus Levybacteria bacterium]|nr:glycosyltransferase family 4 protein [Candidatus Levybacteria bacterium]
MLIGIDGNEANVDEKVGIGEYAFELLRQFEQFRINNLEFRIYLKNKPNKDLPEERNGWKYRVIGPKKFWTQFALPFDLFFNKNRPDVFFTPTHYAPRFSSIPTAVSVMDLSYIHFPDLFKRYDLYQLNNWTAYSVRNASAVFTISRASKGDIIKTYKTKDDKVVVTYPGIKKLSDMSEASSKFEIKGKYILFVGTLQPRKNIVRLIEAFSRICHPERSEGSRDSSAKPQNDISLVIVGKKGWLYDEILEAPSKFGVEKRVKFLDFVEDKDLPLLYKKALCFALPSLYEGFGLPVLEAMKYGCPVVISSVSSLPEVGGDAALYVDPLSVGDIAKKLELIINDNDLRQSLIKKGHEQVKKFSWEKTAKETLKTLEELVIKD